MHKIGVFVAMCAMADAMVPPKKREEGERVVPPLEKKRELSKVRSPTSRAAQIPSCGARKQEFGRQLQDLGYRSWEERPGCHSYHNFGSGILPSVVAPPGLELDDLLCLKVSADSVDGLWAPWHNACYKMEGDECPSDAAVCKFDEAALQGQLCHCTHYKNGAQPSGHDQHMCMTTFNLERASNLDPRAHAVHEGFLPESADEPVMFPLDDNFDGYTPPHAVRICEHPKHGYEEIFGQRIPTCKHPAMACVEPALPDEPALPPCKHSLMTNLLNQYFYPANLIYTPYPLPDVNMDVCPGVESLGVQSFMDTALESIVLPNTLKKIGEKAFVGTKLEKVHIPDSVTYIDTSAYRDLTALTEVTFGPASSLTAIGDSAFQNTGLTHITLPSSLKTIGDAAFLGTKLKKVHIPDSVEYIDSSAFRAIPDLTEVTFGPASSLTAIGEEAFQNTALTHITFPSGLESIGAFAFAGLAMSKPGDPIIIPLSVTNIGYDAFSQIANFVGLDCRGTPTTSGSTACAPAPLT